MKKIFTVFLSLVFVTISILPISYISLADSTASEIQYYETQITDYECTISSNNIILQKYIGSEKNISVPAELTDSASNTYQVKFNNTVFKENENIENVYIQQGVSVNPSNSNFSGSFKNCSSLKTVLGYVPKNVVNAQSLFEGCTNLTEFFDLTSIKGSCYRLFYKCSSLEIIDSLPHGGNNTQFSQFTAGCTNLTNISCSIPETACYFTDSFNCPKLTGEIVFDGETFDHSNDSSVGARENYCNMFNSYYKNGITLKAKKGTSLYNVLMDCASNNSTITVKSTDGEDIKNYIYCIGDSLTAGMGESNTTYPTELNSLLGYNIACRNYSDGGMKITQMSNRVGSSTVKITQDFTIPADTQSVLIQTDEYFDSKYLYKEASSSPAKIGEVTIDGIKGSLTWSSDNNTYFFTRSTAGDEHKVSANTEIITDLSQRINDCDSVLLFLGANDILSNYDNQNSINHVIEKTKEIINYLPTDKYIIAYYGGYYNPDAEQTAKLDEAMSNNFDSSKLINIRAALSENGLEYNLLTPTEEDEDFIKIGKIPSSLMSSDNTHLNTYGYKAVANEFYKKIVKNGYDEVCEKNDLLNHNYDEGTITVDPTCSNYGEITYKCKNNPNHIRKVQLEKSEHNYTVAIVNPTCIDKGYTIHKCKNCDYYFIDNITEKIEHNPITKLTKATLNKNGNIVSTCIDCGEIISSQTIYYPKTISLSTTSYTYDGKEKKPTVKVVGSNGKTISSSNYTVTYASGRKNVGKYAVKITFKGNYTGTKTLYFTIKPKATSISSVSAKSKGFTVKWKKQSTQVTGYQIQYSTSSKFTSPKTVTVSSYKTTSKTISKLKSKKKYYVRVRTYKTVGKTKYYSSWSNAKSVTTKK